MTPKKTNSVHFVILYDFIRKNGSIDILTITLSIFIFVQSVIPEHFHHGYISSHIYLPLRSLCVFEVLDDKVGNVTY